MLSFGMVRTVFGDLAEYYFICHRGFFNGVLVHIFGIHCAICFFFVSGSTLLLQAIVATVSLVGSCLLI
jgi:hypothetical protein